MSKSKLLSMCNKQSVGVSFAYFNYNFPLSSFLLLPALFSLFNKVIICIGSFYELTNAKGFFFVLVQV